MEMSVVITRFKEPFFYVKRCLGSIAKQTNCKAEVLFLDQTVSAQTKIFVNKLNNENIRFKYINIQPKSLSFARNYGMKSSKSKLVVYCDVDCVLPKNWLSEIYKTFKSSDSNIVGTKILPEWEEIPKWYHKSKIIQEFYSLLDLGNDYMEVNKIIGASFAINRNKLGDEGYFNENLGRKSGINLGGEETDLCQRVISSGGKVIYCPSTYAKHFVPKERMRMKWLINRAFFGGFSRALRGGNSEPFHKRYELIDKIAVACISPFYLSGLLAGKLSK